MIDELEIEKWLTNNYDVEFVSSPVFCIKNNKTLLVGVYLINEGIKSLKDLFKLYKKENPEGDISKIYVYRDQIARILNLDFDNRILIRMAITSGNKRYKLKLKKYV